MAEYKYVTLPSKGKSTLAQVVAEKATEELNAVYTSQGWDVVNAVYESVIGQVGFLLRRG